MHRRALPNVELDHVRRNPELGSERPQPIDPPRRQEQLCAAARECSCGRLSDPARCPGDEDDHAYTLRCLTSTKTVLRTEAERPTERRRLKHLVAASFSPRPAPQRAAATQRGLKPAATGCS